MKGISVTATFIGGLNNESKRNISVEAIAVLDDSKYSFTVHSFKDADSGELLPIDEITMRYVTDATTPHWIDEKHRSPTGLTEVLGKAIEATETGKEYIALCFLRSMG